MQITLPDVGETESGQNKRKQPSTAELKRMLAETRRTLDALRKENYIRPAAFGREWGVSPSTVRRWVAAGHLPAEYTPSGRMLIPRHEAEARIREGATITWKRGRNHRAANHGERDVATPREPLSRAS
ncbi:MAG: hypothetical protein QOF51_1479 [Chloroflexota bacterium]|jgi:hypothetical protein|nr:hypothetical protein [Chloroflexota bacterium]